jgi:SAM-dependent methyltransferase
MCDRVTFLPGSSRSIPGNRNFDLIYTSISFHHWKHRAESVGQVLQRVNKGGKFLIFEITDDGSFNRRFVRSHLMERNDFIEIGKTLGMVPELIESGGYIMAAFARD